MSEMKTTMDRFNIRLDTAEKKIHKLEARPEKNREIKERPKDGERKQETKDIMKSSDVLEPVSEIGAKMILLD